MEKSRKSEDAKLMLELKQTVSLGQYVGLTEHIKEVQQYMICTFLVILISGTEAEPESQDKLEPLNNLAGPLDLATGKEFLKRIQNLALKKQQMKENKINYDKLM
ncbi:Hypothetical_protein [Hexamita inflata]|uniref:Hypothetical_protein n=1 Tax=Hexamita inflata TaxID=28002 RepID=A0AA86QGR2_9EUKA|nr:Hypothetical protein HINF_LOCUS38995 [Hexamita inflata]